MSSLERLLHRTASFVTALGVAATPAYVLAQETRGKAGKAASVRPQLGTKGGGRVNIAPHRGAGARIDQAAEKVHATGRLAVDNHSQCIGRVVDYYMPNDRDGIFPLPPRAYPYEERRTLYKGAEYYSLDAEQSAFFQSITGLPHNPVTVVDVRTGTGATSRFTFYRGRSDSVTAEIYPGNGFNVDPTQDAKEKYVREGVELKPCELLFLNPERYANKDDYGDLLAAIKLHRASHQAVAQIERGATAPEAMIPRWAPDVGDNTKLAQEPIPIPAAAAADRAQGIEQRAGGSQAEVGGEETAAHGSATNIVGEFILNGPTYYKPTRLNSSNDLYLVQGLNYRVTTTQKDDEVYSFNTEALLKIARESVGKVSVPVRKKVNSVWQNTTELREILDIETLMRTSLSPRQASALYTRLLSGKITYEFAMTNGEVVLVAMDKQQGSIAFRYARVFPQSVGVTVVKDTSGNATKNFAEGYTVTTTQQRYDAQNPTLTNRDVVWFGSLQDLNVRVPTVTIEGLKDQRTLRNTVVTIQSLMRPEYRVHSLDSQQQYIVIKADELGLTQIVNKTYTGEIGQLVKVETVTLPPSAVAAKPAPKAEPAKIYAAAGQKEASVSYDNDGNLTVEEDHCLVPASAFVGVTLEGRPLAPKDLPIYAATSARMATLQRANADPAANAYALQKFTGGDYKKCVDPKVAAQASEVHVAVPRVSR